MPSSRSSLIHDRSKPILPDLAMTHLENKNNTWTAHWPSDWQPSKSWVWTPNIFRPQIRAALDDVISGERKAEPQSGRRFLKMESVVRASWKVWMKEMSLFKREPELFSVACFSLTVNVSHTRTWKHLKKLTFKGLTFTLNVNKGNTTMADCCSEDLLGKFFWAIKVRRPTSFSFA